MVKLNLGCGFNRLPTHLNVDKFPGCNPDQVFDLEQTPWPWITGSVDEIRMDHVLEHLGQTPDSFLSIVSEVYRILAPDGIWQVTVPHPRHDDFLSDPTHVRAITPTTLEMFDSAKNQQWIAAGLSTTPLALMTRVDFVLEQMQMTPDSVWVERIQRGEAAQADLDHLVWHNNNIAREITMTLRARK